MADPTAPRYLATRNPNAPPETPWGVQDTRTGRFVDGQRFATWAGAHEAAGVHNRTWLAAHADGEDR